MQHLRINNQVQNWYKHEEETTYRGIRANIEGSSSIKNV